MLIIHINSNYQCSYEVCIHSNSFIRTFINNSYQFILRSLYYYFILIHTSSKVVQREGACCRLYGYSEQGYASYTRHRAYIINQRGVDCVCRKLYAMYALYAVCRIPYNICAISRKPYAVCRMLYVWHMQTICAVCRMLYVVSMCRMPYAACCMPYVVCLIPYVICRLLYAICSMPFAVCRILFAVCGMCRMPHYFAAVLCHMRYAVC